MAFTCTNGGCTESQHFGPYSTQASSQASKSKNLDFDNFVCTQQVQMNDFYRQMFVYYGYPAMSKSPNNCSMYL